jgi:hypothetical protein
MPSISIVSLLWVLFGTPPDQPAVQPQPAAQPEPAAQPAQPQPAAQPPQPQPAQPPAEQPAQPQPQSYAGQAQAESVGPVARGPQQTGVGMLVAGPITVALGIPLSFVGNRAWRDNCGPTTSTRKCADGSLASAGAHTLTGFAYAAGITFTAIGAARRGRYDAGQDPTRSGTGFVVGGAVLLPSALIGMGMVRLFMWLPTPDCQTYDCVQRQQNLSTVIVGGLALTASMGAGMLMYGASYNRARPKFNPPVLVLPQAGRHYAGLGLTGQF